MTTKEFNEKYKDYLEEGHYGLDINIPSVVEYLNNIFEYGLTFLPGFKYSQIKLKFGMARFYFDTDIQDKRIEAPIGNRIESEINRLVKEYDESLNKGHNPEIKDIV
jgi:hypothetical protein